MQAALLSVSQSFARSLAKDGIRANALAIGLVPTPMHRPEMMQHIMQEIGVKVD